MNRAIKAVHAVVFIALSPLFTSACHSSTSPSCTDQYGRGDTALNLLNVSCQSTGPQLRCQSVAEVYGLYVYCPRTEDETQVATWTADNQAVLRPVGPGLFEAVGPGDTFVKARWNNLESVGSPVSVFAAGPPVPTWELEGSVYRAGGTPGSDAIDGVVVEVLDGPVAGRKAVAGMPASPVPPGFIDLGAGPGHYVMFGVPAGTYHVRVSKPGFVTIERELVVQGGGSGMVDFPLTSQ